MRRMAQAVIDEFDELADLLRASRGARAPRSRRSSCSPRSTRSSGSPTTARRCSAGGASASSRSLALAKRARIAFEPFGVVAVIGAGSAPFAQPLGQIAGALLAGNGVAFKPAARASLAGERIARVLARADLPEGLVRIVHGGAEAGIALAESPVDKVLFTGSPAVGRAVARACVSREKEVTVELGGKDAMLVLADAHLPRAVAGALWAGCAGAGQCRGSVERVLVVDEVHDAFLGGLVRGARALRVGDPSDERTQVGPLASPRRLEHVRGLVDDATSKGARLLCGGPLQPPAGSYWAPAVLSGVEDSMAIAHEPVDGPVLVVERVGSEEEAIARANEGDYGLGASVWTADRYRGTRIARELHAGMVWLNDHLPGPTVSRGPWGAAAGGGLGRTLGQAGLRACAQEKLITWDPPSLRGLWWGPYDGATARAAQAVARLRSEREADRERAWRSGALTLARLGARALGRGVPEG